MTITWQMGSSNPDNAANLATIRQWWAGLNGKEVTWRQRQLPVSSQASDLNWDPQRFDETVVLSQPELRGITLYWHKPDAPDQERSTTPHKLEFDPLRQQVYIFPQSQKELVIRVAIPEIAYQQVELRDPQIQYDAARRILTLRDEAQVLEVRVALSPDSIDRLKREL